jgi:hypothetical protein
MLISFPITLIKFKKFDCLRFRIIYFLKKLRGVPIYISMQKAAESRNYIGFGNSHVSIGRFADCGATHTS